MKKSTTAESKQSVHSSTAKKQIADLQKALDNQQDITKHLQNLVERYETIFNNSSDGIFYTDNNGIVLNINSEFSYITGIPDTELIGKNAIDLVKRYLTSGQFNSIVPLVTQALSGKQIDKFELTFQEKILEISVHISADQAGITGFIRDITEDRDTLKALSESERRYHMIIEHAGDALIMADFNGNIIEVNKRACESLGYSREELLQFKVGDLDQQPIDYDQQKTIWEKLIPGQPVTIESTHRHKDGYDFPVEIRVDVLEMDGEKVILGVARDITQRKQIEDELRKLSRAVEQSPVSIIITDLNGIIEYVNPKFEELTGYSFEEAVGNSPRFLKSGLQSNEYYKELWDTISRGEKWRGEFANKTKNGEIYWEAATISPIINDQNEITHYIAIKEDITEQKQAEEVRINLETRWKNIIESAPMGMHFYELKNDDKLVFVGFNPAANRILGIDNQQFIGKTIEEAFPPLINTEVPKRYSLAAQKGESWHTDQIDYEKGKVKGAFEVHAFQTSPGKMTAMFLDVTKQKQVEETIRHSEQKFRDMAELLPETIYECDLQGKLTFFNEAALLRFGYISEDMESEFNVFQMLIAEDRDRAQDSFTRIIDGEKIEPEQYTAIRKDGTSFPVIVYSSSIIQEDQPTGLRGIVVDITGRVSAEKALAESNRELIQQRNMFISGPAVIIKWQTSGSEPVEYVSANVQDVLGYTVDELISGQVIYKDIVPEDDWEKLSAEVKIHTERRSTSFEQTPYRIQKKDGQYIWVADYTTVIRDEKGKVINYLGYIIDISNQKNAQNALVESEARYRQVINNSLEGIFIHQNNRIQFCNQQFAQMFGFDHYKQALGFNIEDLVSKNSWEKVNRAVKLRITGEEDIAHYTFRARKIDGTEFEVEALGSRIIYQGKPAVQGVLRDVSEKANLEAQLQQAQKMEAIGQLAGGVAHDFNNMLGGIIGYTELALSRIDDHESVNKYLKYIIEKCDNTAVLVRQLLAFSRRQVLHISQLNLNSNINDSMRFLRRVIGEHIKVTMNLAENLSVINADPTAIDQIITNLCINARDALTDGGNIKITTQNVHSSEISNLNLPEIEPQYYVSLSIADDGVGMDEETLIHIFEPFFTTKTMGQGTGLGLAMVYGLVKQHNGHIECTSDIGLGSAFDLYFPAVTDDYLQEEIWEEDDARGGNETLLLVEDDIDLLKITKTALEKFGYTVIAAGDGKEALHKFERGITDISLVISDIVMPEMGGLELFDEIHNQAPEIKFLFISGYAPSAAYIQYANRPEIELLQKPYRKSIIAQKIRKLLDQ